MAGEWAIKAEIDLKIGIHNCNRYEACQEREDGFIDGLKSTGANFEVVNNQEAFSNDVATQVGTDMLIANPEINLMYAANEGGTIGAVNAVMSSGQIGKTFVMGTDTTAELLNTLLEGEILLAVNSQFPRDMGAGAMRAAIKAVNGEKIDQYVQLTPTKLHQCNNFFFWNRDPKLTLKASPNYTTLKLPSLKIQLSWEINSIN